MFFLTILDYKFSIEVFIKIKDTFLVYIVNTLYMNIIKIA